VKLKIFKMKYSKYIILLVAFTGFISCQKFLDKKSNDILVVPKTLEDLQALLDDANVMNLLTPSFGELSSDDYFVLAATYSGRSLTEQNLYKWTPADYFYPNDWARSYNAVYNANLCLELLEKIEKTTQNKDAWENVRGSALFYRAYCFLNLAWVHSLAYDQTTADSDLGIVLRLGSDYNVPSVRSSVAQTYERIINDAIESISNLPDRPIHVMRPSKGAAYGLLARTYLSMRQYDKAFEYADLCLSLNYPLMDYNSTSITRYNSETIFYSEMYEKWGIVSTSNIRVDTVLYASYNTNDRRRTVFFQASGAYRRFRGSYATGNRKFSGLASDEMYLIRAESSARLGNKDAAMQDLNTLMEKRWNTASWVPFTAATAEEALELILTERRKELLVRGIRWNDIKRLNKENRNIELKRDNSGQITTLPPNDKRYALPLPRDIIDQTGIPQN
jgi:starch-binding outer membrane protein, SusD/RagB family